MSTPRSAHFVNRWTQAATVVTVISGLLVPASTLEVAAVWFWCLAAVYFALLTGGVYLAERTGSPRAQQAYFLLATVLLFGLLMATHGWAWLVGLPLLSHVVLFTSWRWALAWSAAMLCVVFLAAPPTTEWLTVATGLVAAAVFVIAFSVIARREVEWRLRSEQLSESLAAANQQLRAHAAEVAELSAIRERNRVAREVHDGLGHYLTTIHVQLEAARALLDKDIHRARQGLERAQLLAKQGLEDVRESVSLLRHNQRESATLEEVLSELVRGDNDEGIARAVSLDVSGLRRRVSDTVQHALRRVLQEALTNVRRHSDATRVYVHLRFEAAHVVLDVEDDGNNSDARHPPAAMLADAPPRLDDCPFQSPPGRGHGLLGISERIHLLGGKAAFGPTTSGGFRIEVTVPA